MAICLPLAICWFRLFFVCFRPMSQSLLIRELATFDYQTIWDHMRLFTNQRHQDTQDEVWLLEHQPVFTQGLAGKSEHVIDPKKIPVIQTDRGGQITYHGPGQLMVYTLFDLKRLNLGPRQLVRTLEKTVIDLLANYNISATGKSDAPGVYVNNAKICSIGLRIRRGCSYHGIALNVKMNLKPFAYIHPCGFRGLKMTQITDFQPLITLSDIKSQIIPYLIQNFGYTSLAKTMQLWSEHE